MTTGLFDRLPEGLFSPLASQNRRVYWDLLLRLYDRFFGPEAAAPEGEGYAQRVITLEIERHLLDITDWSSEDGGEGPETPLQVRAGMIYRRLLETGWIAEHKIGVRGFVYMTTPVQKFLEILMQFAEEGPQVIGGKVQIIYNQLEQVILDPASQAGGFHEAAIQARQLVTTLSATTMRVREAVKMLTQQETTADFVRSFFDDYIGQIYIRDYHELRTENHPLRHRWRIIEAATTLRDEPVKRRIMVDYYLSAFRCSTREEAERRFEKDVSRFLMFKDIDSHLDRLNASVDRATSNGISVLQYKLRTQGHLDRMLNNALLRLKNDDSVYKPSMGLGVSPMLAETRLPSPPKKRSALKRTVMKKTETTSEQKAMSRLRRAMKLSREVTPGQVDKYLQDNLQERVSITSDDLPITTIHDFCLFVVVTRLALSSQIRGPQGKRGHPMQVALSHFRFDRIQGELTDNPYLQVPKFIVTKQKTESQHAA